MAKDPSKGGEGYPKWFRDRALQVFAAAEGQTVKERAQTTAEELGCSVPSLFRWAALQAQTGSTERLPKAGGHDSTISGAVEVLFLLYLGKRAQIQCP